MVEEEALIQALNIESIISNGYTNFQLEKGRRGGINKIIIRFSSSCEPGSCQEYLQLFERAKYKTYSQKGFNTSCFPLSFSSNKFSREPKGEVVFNIPLTSEVIANLRGIFIVNLFSLKIERAEIPSPLFLTKNDKENRGYIYGFSFSQQRAHSHIQMEQIAKKLFSQYGFELAEEQVNDPSSGLEHYVFVLKDGIGQAITKAIEDFPQLINQQKESPYMLFNVFSRDMQAKSRLIDKISMPQIVNNSVIFRCYNKSQQMINNKEAVKEINRLYGPSLVKLSDDKQYITLNFNYNTISTIMEKVPCDVNYLNEAHQLACKQASGSLEVEEKLSEARDGAASSTSYRPDVPSTNRSSHKRQSSDGSESSMQWNNENKKAFVQALNIKFLTTVGSYTNFQFVKAGSLACKKDEIHMLFSSEQIKECQEYLEQVIEKYKDVVTASKKDDFYIDSFPFCINSGRFSSKNSRGVKFKVLLDEKVIRNSHDILLHQQKTRQIVQEKMKDFLTELFSQHPKSLLMLFNIFYHNISSQDPQKGETDLECMQLIKAWGDFIHKAKTDKNIVYFNHFYSHNADILRDKEIIQKIYDLYRSKKAREAFRDFISIQEGSGGNAKVSFNFDSHNIDVIMAKIPCDIGYVQKAREFAEKQLNGTASPIHTAGPSGVFSAVDVRDKDNQSSNFLQVPASLNRDDSIKSNKSGDSALGASPPSNSNPKSGLHPNATSIDSGHGSNPSSPTKKCKSHQSTPAVSPTSSICTIVKVASIANMKDLESLGPKPDKVKSDKNMRFYRSKSIPSYGDRKVLNTVRVEKEKEKSLSNRRSNSLLSF